MKKVLTQVNKNDPKVSGTAWAKECSKRPMQSIWHNVKCRVNGWNGGRHDTKSYSDKGIDMQPSWKEYQNFEDDLMGIWLHARKVYGDKVELCIDRMDVDKGYHLSNVQFISRFESNTFNKSTSSVYNISYLGKSMPISFWARCYKLDPYLVSKRLQQGWTIQRALNEQPGVYKKTKKPKENPVPLDTRS